MAPIGLGGNEDRLVFRTDREEGRPVFLFEGFDLPARESVGMRLNGRSGGEGDSAPRSASSALRLVMYRVDYGLSAIVSA
ncbi:hypothetical protein [Saccharothrix luteola]|uniref:hypothetical protein n=1 Tax=Saccharothrix luteola TaxID=2893018 RepID=UPI001E47B6C4|nr:hypothetical protein [Saccharothrix luteola]MCC8249605.1 hypothetical protein [Saccharothrix luteola]